MTSTAEITVIPTPREAKILSLIQHPQLYMETPLFVILAGETIANQRVDPEFRGFLAVRVESDCRVL